MFKQWFVHVHGGKPSHGERLAIDYEEIDEVPIEASQSPYEEDYQDYHDAQGEMPHISTVEQIANRFDKQLNSVIRTFKKFSFKKLIE